VLSGVTSDVSDILSRTNQLTTEDVADEEFLITLMLVQYDQLAKSIRYASAGLQAHLIDREGEAHVLPGTGMPIGLRAETIIPEGEIRRIRTGDILLLMTDGMAKMTSPTGEAFGSKRILELVRQHRSLPSRMIVSYLHRAAMEFTHQSSRSDDITVVIIKAEH
jgi:serine phosphatase RsbU (regulator of sigma subunit)